MQQPAGSPWLLALVDEFCSYRPFLQELGEHLGISVELIPELKRAFERLLESSPTGLVISIHQPDSCNIELLAAADAFQLEIPLFVLIPDFGKIKLPFGFCRKLAPLDGNHSHEDLIQMVQRRLAAPIESQKLRVVDYLQLALLGKQSICLELYCGPEQNLHAELVGGDLWNCYLGDVSGAEALTHVVVRNPSNVTVRGLNHIPRERHFRESGFEVLEALKTNALSGRSQKTLEMDIDQIESLLETQEPERNEPELYEPEPQDSAETADLKIATAEDLQRARDLRDRFESLLTRGLEAALRRDYEVALKLFEEAASIDPEDPRVVYNLQQIRRRKK